jgi:hypothetical protein
VLQQKERVVAALLVIVVIYGVAALTVERVNQIQAVAAAAVLIFKQLVVLVAPVL